MNILKRQFALLLVLAMTLTMLPMPAHADEVTDPESPSAIVEESTEKPTVSKDEVSTDAAKKPVEKAESDTAAKENAALAVETPVDTAVDSNTTTTDELIADVSKAVIDTDDTTEDAEIEENTESDPTVDSVEDSIVVDIEESEDAKDSGDDIQEETDQLESETETQVFAAFSFRRSAAKAVAAECEHLETEVAWDTKDQIINCKPISDTQHQISGYQYRYCTSCYERVGESFAATEMGNHELDANGRCGMCGYSSNSGSGSGSDPDPDPDCDHTNTAIGWDPDQLGPWYAQYSDTQHKVSGFRYTYCTDCHARIRDEYGSNNNYYSEEVEGHTLDDNGVCDLCSYGRNTCAHENVVFGYAPLYDPPRYEQYNETQHLVYHIFKKTCLDCGETLSDGEETASLENHVLDNGKCTYCGYGMGEDYCTHPDTDVMWSNAPMTYTSLNEEQHEVEGCQYHYCTSCYKRICADFPVKEWEDHTFDSTGDCTLCNYRVGCEHKQTTMKLYDTLYESLNKDSHEVTRLYSKVCADPDCGKVLVSVETSYTETETEDHDFDGDTCTLCGYTATGTEELTVMAVARGQDVDQGIKITVTANVSGGSGSYQYGWKVLVDGVVKHETDMSMGASYEYTVADGEEGTYSFVVTVKDSEGNTATEKSAAFIIGHTCDYETVTSTQLVNQSLTHHTVETTTYEECTICHEKRNEVTDVQWVEHTPIDAESYGHEAAHPHKKYFICECGSHPYLDGEYHTANGKVQEESVCCICHDHKYGTEDETDEGTRQKTCTNCGLTTVTHTHEYELIQTEKFINPDETKHYVETTSTHKCKICGHEKPGITVTIDEPHSPKNPKDYTYRTAHPHQRYAVCECGKEFNVPGEYEKVNGKLLEPDVCCICHGHKFGEPTVGYGGDLYKTCKNCYFTEIVTALAEPEEEICNHVYSLEGDGTKHPHEIKRVCMRCRAEESFNYTFFDCCQCVGHDWSEVVRLPDGKTYQIGCYRCKESQKVTPSAQIKDFYAVVDIITDRHNAAKQYQEDHEIDSAATAIWKTIAGQATDKLSKGGFVGVNEVLNTYSDMTGSIKGVFEEDDWNQQQTDLWESLLIELLKKEYKAEEESSIKSEDIDYWSGIVGTVEKTSEFIAEQLEDNKDAIRKSINELDEWILEAEENANILLRDGDILASNDMLSKSHKLRDLKAEYEESLESTGKGASSTAKWMKGTALLMDAASIIAAGTEAESAVRDRNNALMDLLKNDQSFIVLSSIIASADAAGEDNLKEAAEKLKTDLEIAKTEAFSDFFSENDAFWKGAGLAFLEKVGDKAGENAFNYALTKGLEKAGVKAAGTVVKDSMFFLSVIESSTKGLKAIVDWGDSYTEAQKLMTINYMDARLNVANFVLEQKDPYIADLWGMLNAEGCVQAQVFLNAWEDGTGLNSKDFGIDNGGWFRDSDLPVVLDQLDEERDFYIDELDLPLEKSK